VNDSRNMGEGSRFHSVLQRTGDYRKLPVAMSLKSRSWQTVGFDPGVLPNLLVLSAALVATHIVVPSAQAASSGTSREREAKQACLAGKVAKGVDILAELYVKIGDPVYIFNQGRCFEQNGKYEEAIARFREFLEKNQDAGKPSDPSAERHIAKCQALLDAQRRKDREASAASSAAPASVAPAPSREASTSSVAAAPAASPTLAAQTTEALAAAPGSAANVVGTAAQPAQADLTQAQPARPGSGLRIAGGAAAAVGVAGLVTGIILNIRANNLTDEIETQRPYTRDREETRQSYQTWGWVGYGVGGAFLAGGAILYLLGSMQGRDSVVAFVPSAGAGSFQATVQGAF
jgi:hypothetical protein